MGSGGDLREECAQYVLRLEDTKHKLLKCSETEKWEESKCNKIIIKEIKSVFIQN